MKSNHTTIRAVGVVFGTIGIIATAVFAFLGFKVNPALGLLAILLGAFATVVATCMFFALANIQENQLILEEYLNGRIDRLEKENIAIFEKLREMNGEPPMDQPPETVETTTESTQTLQTE